MKNHLLLACTLLLLQPSVHAQMTPLMKNSLRFSMAPFGAVATAGRTPMALPTHSASPEAEAITKKIDALFSESPAAMAWLVWRDGNLVYERYGAPELRMSLITSFSVSKTLTSIMIGRALCDQKIKSLDDLAITYVPRLAGTAYEKNTLRSLITMTAGVDHTPAQGGQDLNSLWKGEKTILETIAEKRRMPFQETHFLKTFNYDNTANNVLGLVLRAATNEPLNEYFSRNFYQAADPIQPGRWLRDKAGEEFTMGSFLALPRDHLRLSIHMLKILRGEAGDACIQGYAQQMVKKSVNTPPRPPVYGTDTGYGFQVWTHLSDLPQDIIEMRGNAGQHVFLSPGTSTAIVILTAADQRADERSMQNAKSAVKVLLSR